MRTLSVMILLAAVLVTGCADDEPRIDGTSETTMKDSIKAVCDNLSESDAQDFGNAYVKVSARMAVQGKEIGEICAALHGKTAREVIAMAKDDQ